MKKQQKISSINTAQQAAAILGINDSTVRRLCHLHGIGTKHGRGWALTDAQIALLAKLRTSHTVGRPRVIADSKTKKSGLTI